MTERREQVQLQHAETEMNPVDQTIHDQLIPEQPGGEAPPVEAPPAEPSPFDAYRDRYGNVIEKYGSDPEKVLSALQESQAHISRLEQQIQQPQPEQEQRPLYPMMPGGEPVDVEELHAWARQNPLAAAQWAAQQQQLEPSIRSDVINYAAQVDPYGFHQWQQAEMVAQLDQRIQQAVAPTTQFVRHQIASDTDALLKQQIGVDNFTSYEHKIASVVQANPGMIPAEAYNSAPALASAIRDIYDLIRVREGRAASAAAPAAAAQQQAPPVTQLASSAPPPQPGPASTHPSGLTDEQIIASIIGQDL